MSSGSGNAPQQRHPAAPTTEGIRWDLSAARSSYCTLASASAATRRVVLNFGIPRGRERSPRELEVERLHRVSLSPAAANQLRQLLAHLLAEHDAH